MALGKNKFIRNSVDKYMRSGESGWKPTTHEHKHKKKYSRKDRREHRNLTDLSNFD